MLGVVGEERFDPRDSGEQPRVAPGGRRAQLEDLVETLDQRKADGRRQVGEAGVVAEARVIEPAPRVGAALVRQALDEPPLLLGLDRDRAPFTRRHLLVWVEGEDGGMREGAERRAAVACAERLAGVLDE